MFSDKDSEQIRERGMTIEALERQINHFIKGFPFISLDRPATTVDGIVCFGEDEKKKFISCFEQSIEGLEVVKFVPASGAASRMFRHLFGFREKYKAGPSGEALFNSDHGFNSVWYFIKHLEKVAFYSELSLRLERNGLSLDEMLEKHDYSTIIDHVLTEKGLDYSNLPKGLIRFHAYPDGARTSAEEHMVEAALYASNSSRVARLHFTISPEHRPRFEKLFSNVRDFYESKMKVLFDITYSIQKPSTDTIAVDEKNEPFRNDDGSLLFRPGGHGALLENLNDIDADVIFVKNIDNVVPDRLKDATVLHKKLIGGYLLWVRKHIFGFLRKADSSNWTSDDISDIIEFGKRHLSLTLPGEFHSLTTGAQLKYLFDRLNRPLRVCGMVKNEGEPGGGPYWVKDRQRSLSLQIVESSQVNIKDPQQLAVFRSATHFNPVDLVCSIRDFKGNKFDLSRYADEETGFISIKSSGGKNLKALERPGLWNGAMAEWITVFLEVPIITFNPVKIVNDLLRKEHLGE